jgi:hypothetical protein
MALQTIDEKNKGVPVLSNQIGAAANNKKITEGSLRPTKIQNTNLLRPAWYWTSKKTP